MQSDQDVHVCGIFEKLELPLYDSLYALFPIFGILAIFSFFSFLFFSFFLFFSHAFEHVLIFFSSFCKGDWRES
jgi:hypothetical protein